MRLLASKFEKRSIPDTIKRSVADQMSQDRIKSKIVIGLGTGRCGTVSLQKMLSQIRNSFFVHEGFMLPWYGDPNDAIKKMYTFIRETDKRVCGDVGFYWLPYVDHMIHEFPGIKFICMKRDKIETIKSYLRKTEGRNHWMHHEGKRWRKDVLWDRCYPKFKASSKEEALSKYWDMYYDQAATLEKRYPSHFRIFDLSVLSASENFSKVLEFIAVENQEISPVKENASQLGAPSPRPKTFRERVRTRVLTEKKILPWRIEHRLKKRGGVFNTLLLAPFRRTVLFPYYLREHTSDDITVVIPVRNIEPFRLYHALNSIRRQDYSEGKVHCIIVDYGSVTDKKKQLEAVATQMGSRYIYVNEFGPWNRSRALNIGIRGAESPFIVSSDADIIFSPSFLRKAVELLKVNPCSVIYSYCLDLPEEANNLLVGTWKTKEQVDVYEIKGMAVKRWQTPSYGISVTLKRYYQYLRGYDETYKEWGCEDDDLFVRFIRLGLDPVVLYDSGNFYCHIWHEKRGGLITEAKQRSIEENRAYFRSARGIKRNSKNWGIPMAGDADTTG